MFDRIAFWKRPAARKRGVSPIPADMRPQATLVVGVHALGALREQDAAVAAAFARRVRDAALELWPQLLRDGPVRILAFPAECAHEVCDLLVCVDQDIERLTDRRRRLDAGAPCVRLSSDDPEFRKAAIWTAVEDDFEPPVLRAGGQDRPIQFLARFIFNPPPGGRAAARLLEFLREGPQRPRRRLEYDLLLRLLGPRSKPESEPQVDAWESAERLAPSRESLDDLERLRKTQDYADKHAVYYGDSWRSLVVARSTLLLAPTVISGAIGIAAPSFSSLTAFVQVVIILRIFHDRRRAGRGRWQEKWIDYRDLTERLRCLRYLTLCDAPAAHDQDSADASWVTWYVTRIDRSMRRVPVEDARAPPLMDHLVQVEIKQQIVYHRAVVRRFCALDLRLRALSRAILATAAALGVLLLSLGLLRSGVKGVPWPALTSLGLSVAPTLVDSLNGFRGEFDMVRQGERSARAAAGLARLAREAIDQTPSAATLRRAAQRAAQLMIGDAQRWRSTLEIRTARLRRH